MFINFFLIVKQIEMKQTQKKFLLYTCMHNKDRIIGQLQVDLGSTRQDAAIECGQSYIDE